MRDVDDRQTSGFHVFDLGEQFLDIGLGKRGRGLGRESALSYRSTTLLVRFRPLGLCRRSGHAATDWVACRYRIL
jgi:hypothetical protein